MSRVALIPARGGSKRLPRKNVIDFLGKPIIAYTIEAALKSNLFDKVVVSTEDDEIASIAISYGACVDQRPLELATDQAGVVEVCLDYLKKQRIKKNWIKTLVVLYATAPLRNAKDIESVVELLSDQCHFSLAVTSCNWPVHQVLRANEENIEPLFPGHINLPSSEVEKYCIDNGSTYAVHANAFLQERTFYGEGMKGYLMPNSRSIDIDTVEDLELALYRAEKVAA